MLHNHMSAPLPAIATIIAINLLGKDIVMSSSVKLKETIPYSTMEASPPSLHEDIAQSWSTIAPFWPLKNLIATNPLAGLEALTFEQAYATGAALFQQADLPTFMQHANRITIKWLQAFCDEGQATMAMPLRHKGLYHAVRSLAPFDATLHRSNPVKKAWLEALPHDAETAIAVCLQRLHITSEQRGLFLTLLLSTLSGWSSYVQYRTSWADETDSAHPHAVTHADYLAVRLLILCCVADSDDAEALLDWHQHAVESSANNESKIEAMTAAENAYRLPLLHELSQQAMPYTAPATVQCVFCIDVRSEPFRRAIEAEGAYETFGFAGFFGVPITVEHASTGERYASCPVLLKPQHTVVEHPCCPSGSHHHDAADYETLRGFRRLYQSAKYTFTAPFALVEMLGIFSGVWMALRSFTPSFAHRISTALRRSIRSELDIATDTHNIPFETKCSYALNALKLMGMTNYFAPLVVLCGHGSETQNNAYATALDCGACGGRHGASNARVLADILNMPAVRDYLSTQNIMITDATYFLAAEHNTTTDEVRLFDHDAPATHHHQIADFKTSLHTARQTNTAWRLNTMGGEATDIDSAVRTAARAKDWAQVRPEWGLARNAAFIVAPRALTHKMNLQGRCFLHSYAWQDDKDGALLTTILTAPMVVTQWINAQYLFSTLDNVAYGGGSKITKNITGKIGVMQGNASDLMTGLPFQSVYAADGRPYHETLRLMTVVHAPRTLISKVIAEQPILQKLFGNGWGTLACIDPETQKSYVLERDLSWREAM
jgi:uncharacterized protein